MEIDVVLTENRRRLAALLAPYNPLTGEGSPLSRVRLSFDERRSVLIPESWFVPGRSPPS